MKTGRLVAKKWFIDENGMKNELFYYLTEEKKEKESFYGIIVLKMVGNLIETENSGKLTDKKEKVLEIIELLSRNTITPVCLCEVIDDLFTEIEQKEMSREKIFA